MRIVLVIILATITLTANAIVGKIICSRSEPATLNEIWTVAPHSAGIRKVRYLLGGPNGHNVIMTVPVGSTCYEDTRPGKDCIDPVNCKGESGDRRWRQWRLWPATGNLVGEVYCEAGQ